MYIFVIKTDIFKISQWMVDGSASKPALRQDTGYMVEKTYYETYYVIFHLVKKPLVLVKNDPNRLYG